MSPVCNHREHLHAAMAGIGNPNAVVTPQRLRLLRALGGSVSDVEVARQLGLSSAAFADDVAPLVGAGLVQCDGARHRAAVLVAPTNVVERVDADALQLGLAWAALLRARWPTLATEYARLNVAAAMPFRDAAFLFVGDRILDVGLLDALARDGTLLPPAPPRPAPATPDARYYFWLIEGEHDQLGKYGQRATMLPWPGWALLTFGRYVVNGAANAARAAVEARAEALLADGASAPIALATDLTVPLVAEPDATAWRSIAGTLADELVAVYHAHAPALHALHADAWPAEGAPRFGELVCWHDHLAYAHAIDALAADGLLLLPQEGFTAAVWHEGLRNGDF